MTPEVVATFLAGVLAVPVLQVFKRLTGAGGTVMSFAAFFLSWPIAAVALVVMTDLTWAVLFASPEKLILHGSTVAAVATVTYHVVAEKMGLSDTAPKKK